MRFSDDQIRAAIQRDLAQDVTVPDGHRGALVTFINTDRAEIALATKVNEHWSIDLIATHAWTGANEVGVLSKVTW